MKMTRSMCVLWVLAALTTESALAAPTTSRLPIIDMHLHARTAGYAGSNPPPMCVPFSVMPRWDLPKPIEEGLTFESTPCDKPIAAASTDEQVMRDTIAVMDKRNIIGMVSGNPDLMQFWRKASPARIIPGLDLRITEQGPAHVIFSTPQDVERLHAAGVFQVLGEVMAQYEGLAPNDARMEPYWAVAEKLDVPVGIHMGPGGPGDPYFGIPQYRARNSSALGLEDVLVRHPKLRVYIMHAGYPLIDDLRALLFTHPQVYVDISSIVYTEPRQTFYRYLADIVNAGYGDRIMFGSDQMIWPGVIEPSIRVIEDASFLTEKQKRDIFYNNAARFLRLSKEEIARHHAM